MNKNLYTLSLDSIKYILGLIRDTVDLPANILDDLHIQSTTTYSSYRLDTLLKALKEENIQYCDEAIAGLNKLSKEIITDKLQITNENTIYLLLTDPVDNIYEQWLLINGTPQMIGTTEMKLDSVYTKDEADARYALLTDFNTLTTSFNNLVTSVEKKIDKDKIVTVLDDTVTDEQVAGAKVVVDELGLKANASEVVKKTDIATTINSTSTDDTVPSTKAVNELSIRGTLIDQSVIDKYGTEITKYPCGRWYFDESKVAKQFSDIPWNGACIIDITSINPTLNPWDNRWAYRNYKAQTIAKRGYFIRQLESCETAGTLFDTGWQKVCATSVADVPFTPITFKDSNIVSLGNCGYCVNSGWCHLVLEIQFNADMSFGWTGITNCKIPIPKTSQRTTKMILNSTTTPVKSIICGTQGELVFFGNASNTEQYFGSISYPVADDWRP